MDEISLPNVLVRWIHISSVIVLVGSAVFMRLILMPAASQLPEEAHNSLRKWVTDRWRRFVHPLVALIVLSGIYNLVIRIREVQVTWHILFTLKLILAIYVLFVVSALVGRSQGLQRLRDKSAMFLAINIALAAIIVLVSNIMKNVPLKPEKEEPATSRIESVEQDLATTETVRASRATPGMPVFVR